MIGAEPPDLRADAVELLENLVVVDTEDDHAAHQVVRAVRTSTAHLPFGPDDISLVGDAQHVGSDVGNSREDSLPVLANLGLADKSSTGVGRCLIAIVGGETSDDRIEIVVVDRAG